MKGSREESGVRLVWRHVYISPACSGVRRIPPAHGQRLLLPYHLAVSCILNNILEVVPSPQNFLQTEKQPQMHLSADELSVFAVFLALWVLGAKAAVLLQCFMGRSNSSRKACVTTGCTMLQQALCPRGVTGARLCSWEIFKFKAPVPQSKQCCIMRTVGAQLYCSHRRATMVKGGASSLIWHQHVSWRSRKHISSRLQIYSAHETWLHLGLGLNKSLTDMSVGSYSQSISACHKYICIAHKV